MRGVMDIAKWRYERDSTLKSKKNPVIEKSRRRCLGIFADVALTSVSVLPLIAAKKLALRHSMPKVN